MSGKHITLANGKTNQSKCGKKRTRITPNTDTFYAVWISGKTGEKNILL